MKKKNISKSDKSNKNYARRPIIESQWSMIPQAPTQPIQPAYPMYPSRMPSWYPPGTAYNPIGVPPWAEQPAQLPTSPTMPGQPGTGTPQPPDQYDDGAVIELPPDEGPPVMVDPNYLQGYLRENIGRYVRIDFLIGTNTLIDKAGELIDVGIDYVVLRETETDDLDVGDLYSIKFVKVFL